MHEPRPPAILNKISFGQEPKQLSGRREVVFSSTGDRTRATRAKAAATRPSIASRATLLAESLFATFFPADCRICGEPLLNISRLPVCDTCLASIRPIAGGLCSVCGERLVSPHAFSGEHGEPRCGLCRRLEHPYTKAAAYGSYDGGLRDLIHMLKYQGVRPAANVLGRMLAEVLESLRPAMADRNLVVVPVPLHVSKLRQRGFNQSEVIARVALKLVKERERYALLVDGLERMRDTQSQIGLTRHQRRQNLRGAFRVKQHAAIAGQDVLLVDDVFTTGTTASECARVLRRAGAARVWVATVARTLKAEAQFAQLEAGSDTHLSLAAHG